MTEKKTSNISRCPHCGATDITLDPKTGKLFCHFCRSTIEGVKANAKGDVDSLKGRTIADGASNIIPDESQVLTLKCPSCGAEVVIDAGDIANARCHWCRHNLTVRDKMANGAAPDLVLPFTVDKQIAMAKIRDFVSERKFFANSHFKREFRAENVMQVYLPYMIVDAKVHVSLAGLGEHQTDCYRIGVGDNSHVVYDADEYDILRDFDMTVDDLTVESSQDKLEQKVGVDTKNVINSIMPFDTENALAWDPRYLRGVASERRDVDVEDLVPIARLQIGDIARYNARATTGYYDRGVYWKYQDIKTVGSRWKAAYLPVWLYSYMDITKAGDCQMHYVVVNARTEETSGSVPVNKAKLWVTSAIMSAASLYTVLQFVLADRALTYVEEFIILLAAIPGVVFYQSMMNKYHSLEAKHHHERETVSKVTNMRCKDVKSCKKKAMENSRITGENGKRNYGDLSSVSARAALNESLNKKQKK